MARRTVGARVRSIENEPEQRVELHVDRGWVERMRVVADGAAVLVTGASLELPPVRIVVTRRAVARSAPRVALGEGQPGLVAHGAVDGGVRILESEARRVVQRGHRRRWHLMERLVLGSVALKAGGFGACQE